MMFSFHGMLMNKNMIYLLTNLSLMALCKWCIEMFSVCIITAFSTTEHVLFYDNWKLVTLEKRQVIIFCIREKSNLQ